MERSPRTIIFVENSIAPTGASKALISIVTGLSSRFNFIILSPNPSIFDELTTKADIIGMKFTELTRSIEVALYPFHLLRNAWKIARLTDLYEAPVLHYNDCYNLTGVVVKLLRPSVRLIYHVRLLPTSYLRRIYPVLIRLVFRSADTVICNSRATCSALPENRKKIMIPDGTQVPSYLPPVQAVKDKYELLYVGNYIPGKGQDFALDCFNELCKLRNDVSLKFIGGTMGLPRNEEYKQELISKAELLGLSGVVQFHGFVDKISEEYARADLLLNFSESESFSLVCLEAMAHGTPVVCRDSGGPADFVKNDQTGVILTSDSSAVETSGLIDKLISRPGVRERMRQNAYELVRERFAIDKIIGKLEEVYADR